MSELERNKAIVRSFKTCQGTKDQDATMREIMSADYRRIRGGLVNLAENAQGQGFPEPGLFLRKALPDRVDAIEDIAAEGERVAMLWRLRATHTGNLFGIPPTGKTIDVYEIGFFRVVEGKIVEGWFMADELGLLVQLGCQMPKRKDGRVAPPHAADDGEEADVLINRLIELGADRKKLDVGRDLSRFREENKSRVNVALDPPSALADRRDCIARLIAEDDKVWARFSSLGAGKTGERCEMAEAGIARFDGDEWASSWYLGDRLGLLIQLDALDALEKLGCRPV